MATTKKQFDEASADTAFTIINAVNRVAADTSDASVLRDLAEAYAMVSSVIYPTAAPKASGNAW